MPNQALIDRWIELFPGLENLDAEHLATARGAIRFAQLASGGVAYHQGWEGPNYVMCIEGTTRGKIEVPSKADLASYRGRTSTSGALTE
jgi:hypothetical protein